MMKKYIPITLIIWVIVMATKYDLLLEMTSKNPMIPYMIGTLYISIIISMTICVIYDFLKLIINIFKEEDK